MTWHILMAFGLGVMTGIFLMCLMLMSRREDDLSLGGTTNEQDSTGTRTLFYNDTRR